MKHTSIFLVSILSLSLFGCANVLNQATSDRYSKECGQAERSGNLNAAEQACYRALVNVDWGNLGDEQKSEKMYNLALIKRKLRKLDEAEKLYNESIIIEENQPNPSQEKLGRRFAELAILYGQKNEIEKGIPYVEKLYSQSDIYSGQERYTISGIFYIYSVKLNEMGKENIAKKFSTKALDMGFVPK